MKSVYLVKRSAAVCVYVVVIVVVFFSFCYMDANQNHSGENNSSLFRPNSNHFVVTLFALRTSINPMTIYFHIMHFWHTK